LPGGATIARPSTGVVDQALKFGGEFAVFAMRIGGDISFILCLRSAVHAQINAKVRQNFSPIDVASFTRYIRISREAGWRSVPKLVYPLDGIAQENGLVQTSGRFGGSMDGFVNNSGVCEYV
jgi:hypothetical protein